MAGMYRQIVESEQFSSAKSLLFPNIKRLDDMLNGITWALARHPEEFPCVPCTSLYMAATDPFPDAPAIRVWYTFDDGNVTMLDIELV